MNTDGYAVSHYAGNVYLLGTDQPLRLDQITDGTSNTILAGEAAGNYQPWATPPTGVIHLSASIARPTGSATRSGPSLP